MAEWNAIVALAPDFITWKDVYENSACFQHPVDLLKGPRELANVLEYLIGEHGIEFFVWERYVSVLKLKDTMIH